MASCWSAYAGDEGARHAGITCDTLQAQHLLGAKLCKGLLALGCVGMHRALLTKKVDKLIKLKQRFKTKVT